MHILFVTPRIPYPLNTGAKIRTFNLLKNAAQTHKVTLLSFYFEENKEALKNLESLGVKCEFVKSKESINPLTIFSHRPASIEKYHQKEMELKLKEIITKEKVDIIHFDHLHMGQYRDSVNGIPSVLDEHNVESIILKRCAGIERNYLKRILFKSQAKKMAVFEGDLIRKFSKCLAVSDIDKENLAKLSRGGENIEVVPNGVDTDYFMTRDGGRETRDEGRRTRDEDALVFTGSMDWLPNSDAVIYFVKEIMPLIWAKNNQVKFYIVGKNPLKDLVSLSRKDSRVIITGIVEDVRPYIAKSKVFVVPIRVGGGTRLKILEALALEKAVVTTSIGVEGLEARDREHLLVADRPREFSEKVVMLLNNEELREKLGKQGREFVEKRYDWRIIGEKLNSLYKSIVTD